MSSRHVRPLLSAYLDGEATPEERRQVERHLAGCPDCARVLAEYRDLGSNIRELSRPMPPATLHGNVWRAIERGETQARWGPATAGWLRLGAIAAVLVLAAVVGWGIINRPGPQAAAHPVDPSPGEKNVARNTVIVIDFDKPVAEYLREPSAIPSVFDLSPPGVYTPSWGANGQELYINPASTANWAAQTTYTVT